MRFKSPGIALRRIATGRIAGLLVAVVAFGVSIWCARQSAQMNADYLRWIDARPMETSVDLSQPGETTVPFYQTCGIAHGEALYLHCDLDNEPARNPDELLEDLSGSVVINDFEGKEIESVTFNNTTAQSWDGEIMLVGFAPFRKGDYFATIRVTSGAQALADKRQTIYAEYQLCGLEQMPAKIAGAVAFGAGMIGFVAAACVLPGLLQGGFWRHVSTENT